MGICTVPLPSRVRNAKQLSFLAAIFVMPGCGGSLWDTGSGETEGPDEHYQGVNVGCQNIPDDAGADETSADGGGAQADNWWWEMWLS